MGKAGHTLIHDEVIFQSFSKYLWDIHCAITELKELVQWGKDKCLRKQILAAERSVMARVSMTCLWDHISVHPAQIGKVRKSLKDELAVRKEETKAICGHYNEMHKIKDNEISLPCSWNWKQSRCSWERDESGESWSVPDGRTASEPREQVCCHHGHAASSVAWLPATTGMPTWGVAGPYP